MRFLKNAIPYGIAIILFVIPFFWLQLGEMNLGGDSSRLYFYDPLSYLSSQTLYNIVSSGMGGEAISYYSLPYFILLYFLKLILESSTLVIALLNGIGMSVAFLATYLIIKELVGFSKNTPGQQRAKRFYVELVAIIGGLFYVLSPVSVYTWDRAILSQTQVFLNPLMFYFLLMYVLSYKKIYITGFLFLSFIFSLNFSYVSAPPFFAFYPLSVVFIILYALFVRKSRIPIKGLVTAFFAFLFLQAFHLFPHLLSLFSFRSEAFSNVYSEAGKFKRGLDYFLGIAPEVKVSFSFLHVPQLTPVGIASYLSFIFPLIIILGFLRNKGKTLLLTGLFFLVVIFFYSANISNIGFDIYVTLFKIPGFSMFRNFFGQWGFMYVFFYTLIFAQCLFIFLSETRKFIRTLVVLSLLALTIVNGWPLLSGYVINLPFWNTRHLRQVITMDPKYEQVLRYVALNTVDGKILSLPMVGPGYQVLAGENGGIYAGPSTFSYLLGKNDFTGYGSFGEDLSPYFLDFSQARDYLQLERLLQLFNIKYIFHNSDEYIYNEESPRGLYEDAKRFLPRSQAEYKSFINNLPVEKQAIFGEKYHLFSLKDTSYLPHIYTFPDVIYTTNPLNASLFLASQYDYRTPFVQLDVLQDKNAKVVIEAENDNTLIGLKNNVHLHKHDPFVTRELNDMFYPFVQLREEFALKQLEGSHEAYFNMSFLILAKRITELRNWGDVTPILKEEKSAPDIWEIHRWKDYNSWEVTISRYRESMARLINLANTSPELVYIKEKLKMQIREQLDQHELVLLRVIKQSKKTREEKDYLVSFARKTYDDLHSQLELERHNPQTISYRVIIPQRGFEYDILLSDNSSSYAALTDSTLKISGVTLSPKKVENEEDLIHFGSVHINENQELIIEYTPANLITSSFWQEPGVVNDATDLLELLISNPTTGSDIGHTIEVSGWVPNQQYLISFDYKTLGDDFRFKFIEKGDLEEITDFEKNLYAIEWEHHQSVITAREGTNRAYIHISSNTENKTSKILIRNLSVVKLASPRIFLQKKVDNGLDESSVPAITFTKINPTKYRIDVSNAHDRYALVFLETFNNNWKLFDVSTSKSGVTAKIVETLGAILEKTVGIFNEKNSSDRISATYFDGQVREGDHTNIFLDAKTFETWGKRNIADDRHYIVNHYANAWVVEPHDMHDKEDYILILEMSTQKHFYWFLSVSLAAFIVLVGYFVRIVLKNGKSN